MASVSEAKILHVSIEKPPDAVYRFVSNPENLPKWAAGLCRSARQVVGEWLLDTPRGSVRIKFAPENDFGALDHTVTLESGQEIHVPMRVVPNGSGSELIFTLFRSPGMSHEQFEADAGLVERDLNVLKTILEE